MKQLAQQVSKYFQHFTDDSKSNSSNITPQSNPQEVIFIQSNQQTISLVPRALSALFHGRNAKPRPSIKLNKVQTSYMAGLGFKKYTEDASEWDSDDFSQPEMSPEEVMNRLISPSKSCISFDDRPLSCFINEEAGHDASKYASKDDMLILLLMQEKAALLNFLHSQQAEMHIKATEMGKEKERLEKEIMRLESLDELYDEEYIIKEASHQEILQQLILEEQGLDYKIEDLTLEYEQLCQNLQSTQMNEERAKETIEEMHKEIKRIEHDLINRRDKVDSEVKNKVRKKRAIASEIQDIAVQHEILRETVEQLKENNKHLKYKYDTLQQKVNSSNGLDLITREIEIAKLQLQTAYNKQKNLTAAISDLDQGIEMISESSYRIKSEEDPGLESCPNEILDVKSISRSSSLKDGQDESFQNTVVIKQSAEDTLNLTEDLNELSEQINILEEMIEVRNEILKEYQELPKEDWIHRTALRSELAKANYQIAEIQNFIRNKAIVFP